MGLVEPLTSSPRKVRREPYREGDFWPSAESHPPHSGTFRAPWRTLTLRTSSPIPQIIKPTGSGNPNMTSSVEVVAKTDFKMTITDTRAIYLPYWFLKEVA